MTCKNRFNGCVNREHVSAEGSKVKRYPPPNLLFALYPYKWLDFATLSISCPATDRTITKLSLFQHVCSCYVLILISCRLFPNFSYVQYLVTREFVYLPGSVSASELRVGGSTGPRLSGSCLPAISSASEWALHQKTLQDPNWWSSAVPWNLELGREEAGGSP